MGGYTTKGIDRRRAEGLVVGLMRIPGASREEGQVARRVRQVLRDAGVPSTAITADRAHEKTREPGEVGNLIVKLPGTRRGPRRLFSAHLDTVPICVGARPVRRGRRIESGKPGTGIGADDRAGCAVILTALREILRRKLPHPPLTFCWFVQEEIGLQGSRHVNRRLLGRPKEGYNWDGGAAEKLTIGAVGGYRMAITVEGIASHAGGAPERGVSAITAASLAVARLETEGWLGAVQKPHGRGTSNVGVIRGGRATNVVADRVELLAEARSHDPDFRREIVEAFETAFADAAARVTNVSGASAKVSVAGRLDYEAYRIDAEHPVVRAAERAVAAVGGTPQLAIADGGLDANWLNVHGIPTVSIGCGQSNQHMADEALDLDQYLAACAMAVHLATAP